MPSVEINGHHMYYEIHGEGDPAICVGGWGTFCHGRTRNLARGLTDRYTTLIIDYRGIGDSTDDLTVAPSTELYSDDIIALFEHLGWSNVHFIGLVGMGACIAQKVAIKRPDMVRSMVNMGAWSYADQFLKDQLALFKDIHREMGFAMFQKHVLVMSFLPHYYNDNHERLSGPDGAWGELYGREVAHGRLVEACISHDTRKDLGQIRCPSLVIHAGQDVVTGPRTTKQISERIPHCEEVTMEDVAHVVAGKDEKIRFCKILFDFLDAH